MTQVRYKLESYQIIQKCYEVHNKLGPGFLEVVYKDALEYEFKNSNILFQREKQYEITYKEVKLPHSFFADFIVFDNIILEIKAVSAIREEFIAQSINYLKASQNKLALLVNFGEPRLAFKRIVY